MTKVKVQFVLLLIFLLVLGVDSTYAQQGNIFTNFKKTINRADQYYDDFSYVSAIALYKKVLEKEPDNRYAQLKIARSFKKLNEPQAAELWYRMAMENNPSVEPLDQLYFAQILMTNGKPTEAKSWLIRYTQSKKDIRAVNNLMGIENYALFFKDSALYTIQSTSINSDKDDFSPVFYDNSLIFLSNRKKTSPIKYINTWTQEGFYDVYQADLSQENKNSTPRVFNKTISSKYHEGPLVFYNKGQSMVFTRSIEQKNSKGDRILGLFFAERAKGNKEWENIRPYPFNNEEYSIFHPAITEDGDTLYFSSKMPGGYGGADIYRSVKKGGTWGKPENMGSQINTEGNELFPYLDNHIMYFSSDGHAGLGGLDIYQVELYKNDRLQVVNMGYPINSTYDDFSLAWQDDKSKGALSSNRPNGYGNDDIYFFQYKAIQTPQLVAIRGKVVDKSKRSPVDDASVYIIDEETGDDYTLEVDEQGNFRFQGIIGHSYTLLADNATKSGLLSGKTIQDADEIIEMEIWGFPPYIVLAIEAKDEASGQVLKLATVRLKENEKIISQEQTDFDGRAILMGNAGSNYTVEVSSVGYVSDMQKLTIPQENRSDTVKFAIKLEKIKPKLAQVKGIVTNALKNTPLTEATVYIIDAKTTETIQLTTQNEGTFEFEGFIGNTYRVIAEVNDNRAVIDYKVEDPSIEANQSIQLEINIKEQELRVDHIAIKIALKEAQTEEGIPFGVVKLFHEDTIRLLDYTNLEGELEINVEKGKEYLIVSDVLGYKESSLTFNTAKRSAADTVSFILSIEKLAQPVISARAIDQITGEGMTSAKVYIINETTGEEQETETAEDGKFVFRGKEGEVISILAEANQKHGSVKQMVLASHHYFNIVQVPLYEKAKMLYIAINLTDKKSGEGVPLAEVQLKQQENAVLFTKSDMWGNANLKTKAGGDYALEISHANYKPLTIPLEINLNSDDSVRLPIALEKVVPDFVTMRGSVYMSGSQLPVMGAQVLVINKGTTESSMQITDSAGAFSFKAKAGEVYNIIGDHQESSGIITDLVIDEGNIAIHLPIQNPSNLSPIAPSLNNPLLTKSVRQIIAENKIKVSKVTGYVFDKTTEVAVNNAMVYVINNNTGEAYTLQTDQKGFFQFNGRIGQEFTLLADKDTRSALLPYAQIAHVTDTLKLSIWGFPPPVVVHVQVFDQASKQRLQFVDVSLKEYDKIVQQGQTQISRGVFLRAAAGAKYQVLANSDGYEPQLLDFEIPEMNREDTLSFEMFLTKKQPVAIAITGKVLDESTEKGVDSVLIYMMNSSTWDVETTITNKKGHFNFQGLEGEQYQIIGEKSLRGTNLLDIIAQPKPDTVVLKIQSNLSEADELANEVYLRITFQDKKTGKTIPQGLLQIIGQDTITQTAYTNQEGYKILKIKTNTSYYVEGSMKDYKKAGKTIKAQNRDQSDTLQILLALEPLEKKVEMISGHAIDGTTLQEIAGAKIYLRNDKTGEEQEVTTNDGGKFTFKGMVGEIYTIIAESVGNRGSINKFLLKEAHLSTPVQITLYTIPVPVVLKVRLKDENEAVIPLAHLTLSYGATYEQNVRSNSHGEALFYTHSGKDYILAVKHPAYKNKLTTVPATNVTSDTIDVILNLEKEIPLSIALHGHVYDGENNKPLSHANIYIINNQNEETLEFKADERGDFSFQAVVGFTYTILADNHIRSGMISDLLVYDPKDKANPFLKIPAFGVLHPITILTKVIDQDTQKAITGATVRQYAQNIFIKENLTNAVGEAIWEEYKNEGYAIVIEKARYEKKLVPIEFGSVHSGDTLIINVPLKRTMSSQLLVSNSLDSLETSNPLKSIRIVHNNSGNKQVFVSLEKGLFAYKQINTKAVLDNDKEVIVLSEKLLEEQDLLQQLYKLLALENLKIQDTITIQNVYYGFDKFSLDAKAIVELNAIAQLMKLYPEINVELKAYTDSRGSANYNLVLAKRRALSAFQYLIKQGISHTRIIQTPIGKAGFVKDCSEAPCTEDDHRLNRRTEMVIKFEVALLGNNE